MMRNMTLENMAAACGGKLVMPEGSVRADSLSCAQGLVIDSRLVKPGYVFAATKGERVDGHSFIGAAFEKGAMAVICEKLPEKAAGPCIKVKDSFEALKDLAAYYRDQFDIPFIGITGSVGKTSTKEFIAGVLSQHFKVHKTEGNFNNEVGVPLTLFGLTDEDQAAVVEMGINTFGEMHRLSRMVRPDIVVMTNIGECHLEFLGDRDGVLRAKSEIFDFMASDGTVFVNGDDDKLATIKEVHGIRPVTFGFSPDRDIWAEQVASQGLKGSSALIHTPAGDIRASVPLPGTHMIGNAMAAAAVGLKLGLSLDEISRGIASVQPVDGRSHLIDTGTIMIVDDCYNANPASVRAAVDTLVSAGTRTAAILGDMFELGSDEKALHRQVGEYAAGKGVDVLLFAGELSRSAWEGAAEAGSSSQIIRWYETRDQLMEALPGYIRKGDTILVKASHGMEFGAVVEKRKEVTA